VEVYADQLTIDDIRYDSAKSEWKDKDQQAFEQLKSKLWNSKRPKVH